MGLSGSLASLFVAAIAGSFHLVILPRKMPEYAARESVSLANLRQIVSQHDRAGRHR